MSGPLDLDAVMDGLAAAAQTVLDAGRTAFGWPVESAANGDAVVGYPIDEPVEMALTFGRGLDTVTIPVWFPCGLPQDRSTRERVSGLIGSGSVQAAIDGSLGGSCSDATVVRATIVEWQPTGQPAQIAVRFDVDILS